MNHVSPVGTPALVPALVEDTAEQPERSAKTPQAHALVCDPDPDLAATWAVTWAVALARGVWILLLGALVTTGCNGDPAARLDAVQVQFDTDGLVVSLPAGHPWHSLRLAQAGGQVLLTQPVPPQTALPVRFEYPWQPSEPLLLQGVMGNRQVAAKSLATPSAALPPLTITAQFPTAVAVEADGPGGSSKGITLPLGARGEMALQFDIRDTSLHQVRVVIRAEGTLALETGPASGTAGNTGSTGSTGSTEESTTRPAIPSTVILQEEWERRVSLGISGERILLPIPFSTRAGAGPGSIHWAVYPTYPVGLVNSIDPDEARSPALGVAHPTEGAADGWTADGAAAAAGEKTPSDPLAAGIIQVRVEAVARLAETLEFMQPALPVDARGVALPQSPRGRLVREPPWVARLRYRLGWGDSPDPLLPAAYARAAARNNGVGSVLVQARSFVGQSARGPALSAFGDPLRGGNAAEVTLHRVTPGQETVVVHPVFLPPATSAAFNTGAASGTMPPGGYWYCTTWSLWGLPGGSTGVLAEGNVQPSDSITRCGPFEVAETPVVSWLLVWGLSALSVIGLAWALWRLDSWVRGFPVRDLVLLALGVGLAFGLVSLPYALLHPLALLLTGPFVFLVEGLLYKGLLFLLLGSLLALVPRPGAFLLFYLVWAVTQAALNGHYTPQVLLFAGAAVATLEGAFWIAGITRRGAVPSWAGGIWLAALVVGLGEGLVVFWHLQLIKVLYRQFYADWYLLAQAGTATVYATIGFATGWHLGQRLCRMQRPPQPDRDTPLSPHSQPHAPGAPLLSVANLGVAYAVANSSWPDGPDDPDGKVPTPEGGQRLPRSPGEVTAAALREISFSVAAGELVLLCGPSGGGKTTLLRAIQGLIPLSPRSQVSVCGMDFTAVPPMERGGRTGLLFQEPELQVVRHRALDDVLFGLTLDPPVYRGQTDQRDAARTDAGRANAGRADAGTGRATELGEQGELGETERLGERREPSRSAHRRALAALAHLGVADLATHPTGELSGGELQRVALAGVTARQPELLLLDEPLAHLDAAARVTLVELLRDLTQDGLGVVVAEHRLDLLLPVADRVIVLVGGRVVWNGRTDGFLTTPHARALLPIPPAAEAGTSAAASHSLTREPSAPMSRGNALGAATVAAAQSALASLGEPLLELRALALGPGGRLGLIDAVLKTGEAVALTGANGAGKTTLLETIAGLRRIAGGRLEWRGTPRIGYLPRNGDLILRGPTVRAGLLRAIRQGRQSRASRTSQGGQHTPEAAAQAWLVRLEMESAAEHFPQLLSRGERQRLALAMTLAGAPDVLLLDEPFAGQDPAHATWVLGLCAAHLAAAPGRALIVATHDPQWLANLAESTWQLQDRSLRCIAGGATLIPNQKQPTARADTAQSTEFTTQQLAET